MPFSSCFLLPGVKKDIKEEAVKKMNSHFFTAPFLCERIIEEYDSDAAELIIREIIINWTSRTTLLHGISSMYFYYT